jgi:hypothetical protein
MTYAQQLAVTFSGHSVVMLQDINIKMQLYSTYSLALKAAVGSLRVYTNISQK